ncbi:hypothetical protein CEXT_72231 [Caerostris extrusa]|uniref:Uncharacterized protein n=1 Tax=Caerostris extrusa TaxID=172846 RepID=A0AAV4VD46_CAEEX|nr:hypothetical protein CEXT_72231 [Caerostris extrusa]
MSALSSSFLLLSKRSFTIGKVSPQYKFSPSFHYQKRCLCTDNSNNDGNSKKDDKDTRSSTSTKGSKFKERVKQDVNTVAAAKKKLFKLLEGMAESSGNKNEVSSDLKLAKPVKKPILSKQKIQKAEVERRMLEKYPHLKIEKAAKKVAYSIDGDQAKTLSELNEKLRKMNLIPSSPQSSADVKDDTVLSHETEENLMSSVKKVASTVTDGTPPRMSKFAQRFGRLSAKGKLSDLPEKPINAMLKGMIVQKQIQQRKSKGFLKEHQQNCLLQGI